jgi:hypothetical protein
MGAGQLITGAVLSCTEMSCVQLELFPQSSVAVQVRVMVNSCGQVPPATLSEKVTAGAGSQLSLAVAVPVTAGLVPLPQSTLMGAGQLITGAVLSCTEMSCVQLELFPQSSVAVQVRVMVNSCGQAPPAVASE